MAPDVGSEEYSQQSISLSEVVAFQDFAAKTYQSRRKFLLYPKDYFNFFFSSYLIFGNVGRLIGPFPWVWHLTFF